MKKEIVIAIFMGFVVGLIITFGIHTANKAIKQNQNPLETPIPTITEASPLASPQMDLVIDEPEDKIVVNKNRVIVSGQTEPENIVAVLGEEDEALLEADQSGLFTTEIGLINGVNQIKAISVNKDNQRVEKAVTVVYSTAKIE